MDAHLIALIALVLGALVVGSRLADRVTRSADRRSADDAVVWDRRFRRAAVPRQHPAYSEDAGMSRAS